MTRDEMREKAAEAAYEALRGREHPIWREADGLQRMCAFICFDAMVAAIESTGHVVVPREPTEEMQHSGGAALYYNWIETDEYRTEVAAGAIYQAMLTAYGQEGKS